MRQNARLILRAAPVPGSACGVEIREGSPFGPIPGFRKIPDSPESGPDGYAQIPCDLENGYGSHGLCFVFRGEGDDLTRFGGFSIDPVRD